MFFLDSTEFTIWISFQVNHVDKAFGVFGMQLQPENNVKMTLFSGGFGTSPKNNVYYNAEVVSKSQNDCFSTFLQPENDVVTTLLYSENT